MDANNGKTVEIVLKDTPSSLASGEVIIMEDPTVADSSKKVAAQYVKITREGTSDTQTLNLDIQLKNSTVTLGDGETAQTFASVAATTSEILNIEGKATVTSLVINGEGGNVFVKSGATVTGTNNISSTDENPHTVIYQNKSDVGSTSSNNVNILPEFVYDITSASGNFNKTVDVKDDLTADELKTAITIKKNVKGLTINLNGKTLTSAGSVLSIPAGAEVTIVNNVLKGDGTVDATSTKVGSLVSTSKSAAAVVIAKGGELELNGKYATISNANGTAVAADSLGAKFTLTDGTLTVGSGKSAVLLNAQATAELNGGTIFSGRVTLRDRSTANIHISVPGLVDLYTNSVATVDVEDGVTTNNISLAKVSADNSTANITAKSITNSKGSIEISNGGNVTLNAGNATAGVTLTGAESKFTMKNGTAVPSIDATAGTVIIEGGKVTATESTVALKLKDGATATIDTEAGENKPEITSVSGAAISAAGSSSVTINNGTINSTSAAAITTDASTIVINDGTVTSEAKEAIVDAGSSASTITINKGTISTTESSTGTDAIAITKGSKVTVKGGTITGTASAVSLTSGDLEVPTDAAEGTAFNGVKVISAVPADDSNVTVNLLGANATYTSSSVNGEWALYNSTVTAASSNSTATAAKLKIKAGKFIGDIISDKGEYFIEGGYFKNCKNLEKETNDHYFATTKTFGSATTDGFWQVITKSK